MTERELIAQARAGDPNAFERLVRDNQDRVYSLCLRMAGDRHEAEDLAQEVFLKAWQGLASFQGESKFSTWLFRLTANLCIDAQRKRERRRSVEPAVSLDDPDSSWREPSDPRQDPQRQLERTERSRALDRALTRLSDDQRQIVVLRELAGLSYQEISQRLGLDLGTVKSRLARGRLALRKILLEDGNFFDAPPSNPVKNKTRGG